MIVEGRKRNIHCCVGIRRLELEMLSKKENKRSKVSLTRLGASLDDGAINLNSPSSASVSSLRYLRKLLPDRNIFDNRTHFQENELRATLSQASKRPSLAERRKKFFALKHTNSAPDSFNVSPTEHAKSIRKALESVMKTAVLDLDFRPGSPNQHQTRPKPLTTVADLLEERFKFSEDKSRVEHFSDLGYPRGDPPCHFCCKQASRPIHDKTRLQIFSGGLVRARDGGRNSGPLPYIDLPSPSVSATSEKSPSEDEAVTEIIEETPSPSVLTNRRRALVPPKPLYGDSGGEESEQSGKSRKHSTSELDLPRSRARGGSIVVIPPMQICPGDLLVYSKALTNQVTSDDWHGSTHSLAYPEPSISKKGKNSWSLLKLFDRNNRSKSESLSGLEEVLACIRPSNFYDEQLGKYKGLTWITFVAQHSMEEKRKDKLNDTSSVDSNATLSETYTKPMHRATSRLMLRNSMRQYSVPERDNEYSEPSQNISSSSHCFSCHRKANYPSRLPTSGSEASLCDSSPSEDRNETDGPTPYSSAEMLAQKSQSNRTNLHYDRMQSSSSNLTEDLTSRLNQRFTHGITRANSEKQLRRPLLRSLSLARGCGSGPPASNRQVQHGNESLVVHRNTATAPELTSYEHQTDIEKNILKRKEATWDLFQTKLGFLQEHLMVLKNSTKATSLSQAFHRYALNYINALNYLESLRRHSDFCEFEKWCSRDPRCKKLQLTDLLVSPVQHIMKTPLLLKEIEQRTEDIFEKEIITKILEAEESSLRELDDKMKWLKNFERLLEIQRALVWPSVLELEQKTFVPDFLRLALAKQPCERLIVSPRRQIILEGNLQLLDTGKPCEMHVILFDDLLLITRKKKGLLKKKSSLSENWPASCSRPCADRTSDSLMRLVVHKQPLSLDRFFIHEVTSQESLASKLDHTFVIIILNRFQQITNIHTFQANTDVTKLNWTTKIRETQERWKHTLRNTVFRTQKLNQARSGVRNSSEC
ncbi:uncharacterized protein LOC136035501 isoform X3 [Artemia franciscana]|uniref:uncharacterized protein LOC136035501 isoform X3 n=1 Tax=Artemia franciscana TaxID=6661 RepID=UPI0032D9C076